MDLFLSKLTQHAMNHAIRCGIAFTASFAIRQSSRLLKNVAGTDREELLVLQKRLRNKIQVIAPAIDMIELIAARGNTSLESAVSLTKSLRFDIQSLARRLERAATAEELARTGATSAQVRARNEAEIKFIIQDITRVLDRIEDAVPLMNLAITTSGASLSTTLPSTVSPSRLLQASTFLSTCDTQYSISAPRAVQAGPTFTLSMYMLFTSHIRPQDEQSVREMTWKEVMHKARVKLRRVPIDVLFEPEERQEKPSHLPAAARADEFAYQILIVEDLDDGRVHTFDEAEAQPENYEGVSQAGIRGIVPIHQISKIFYADTGKMLNIGSEGESNSPVLLLKRDINAIPPRRMLERDEMEYADLEQEDSEDDGLQSQIDAQLNGGSTSTDEQNYYDSLSERNIPEPWQLPPGLDPEWIAFEVYQDEDNDDESDTETEPAPSPARRALSSRTPSLDPHAMANLSINSPSCSPPSRARSPPHLSNQAVQDHPTSTVSNPLFNNIRTSLSLLEMLLRLTSLQQFQQQSHLSITDELLNFFLEESSSTGAGGDEYHRQRVRAEARRKVGWDPYDESPLKRRGEEYQYRYYAEQSEDGGGMPERYAYGSYEDLGPLSPGGEAGRYHTRSREQTPESPSALPPRPSRASVLGAAGGRKGSGAQFRGSPLSKRPTTAQTDEGLGTSPGFTTVVPEKERRR